MKTSILASVIALTVWSCSDKSPSLDCVANYDNVICDESVGAICDSVFHRCMCEDRPGNSCPCTSHSQCQSLVCKFSEDRSSSGSPDRLIGSCVPRSQITYVNLGSQNAVSNNCTNETLGSQRCPYDNLDTAFRTLSRSSGRSIIHLQGTLPTLFDLLIDGSQDLPAEISIVGTYDQMVADFWSGVTNPTLSIFKEGIKITQTAKTGSINAIFDSVVVYQKIILAGVKTMSTQPSVRFVRSNLTNLEFPIEQNLVDLFIDKSKISTSSEKVFYSSSMTRDFKTQLTNTTIIKNQGKEPKLTRLLDNYFETDDVTLMYNSIILKDFQIGYCPRKQSGFAGNLLWDIPKDGCSSFFKESNGLPSEFLNETPIVAEVSEPLGCIRPYRLPEDSKLRIYRSVQNDVPDVAGLVRFDFCEMRRDTNLALMGALVSP